MHLKRQTYFSLFVAAKGIIRQQVFTCLHVLILVPTLLSISLEAHSQEATILVLGDSLSAAHGIKKEEGWVSLLNTKLMKEGYSYRIVNASISGETTEGGLSRLAPLLKEYQPDLLLIELGANDGLRGYPIKILHNNLNSIIEMGKHNHAQILLIAVQIPVNYGPRYTSKFDQSFVDLSKINKIPLAPSLLGKVPLDDKLMQKDGLHPNALAQPQLLDHVWPYLQPLLKKHLFIK